MTDRRAILITRPARQAAPFAKTLESQGFQTLIEPMLEVVSLPFAPVDSGRYQAVLLTSANAAPALETACDKQDIAIYTVGPQTAIAVRQAGFSNVHPAEGTAAALSLRIQAELQPGAGSLLYLRGRTVSCPLDRTLAKSGFTVDAPVVYEALLSTALSPACQSALNAGHTEAVTFFSKRTALNFMKLVEKHSLGDKLRDIKALSISKPVLECVQAGNWLDTYAAPTPDRDGMVDLVGNVCVRAG